MTWPRGGLQHSDGAGNLVFASHINTKAMQERGNKVINGCEVTEQSPTPDLTVEVEAGNVIANGVVVAVSSTDPFAGTPVTFATTQGNLTGGQAEFVAVHVDSSGVITNTEGGAATAGQQTPPEVPEDEVLLAMITLTEGDTTISTVDIEDWRQFVPDGQYIAGNNKIAGNSEVTGNLDISGHDLATIGLKLAGTLVTSSAAELNVLDGVTAFSGTPSDIANSSSDGSSTVIPRLDHVHAHPSGLTSSLHHTKYTDAEADVRAALQDHDHATPISTHAGAVDPHQDRAYSDGLGHHTKYALTEDLTSGEITQLKNINAVTIANSQWADLGNFPREYQVPIMENWENGDGFSANSTNRGIKSTADALDHFAYVYIILPKNATAIKYRIRRVITGFFSGNAAFDGRLQKSSSGGAWADVDSDNQNISGDSDVTETRTFALSTYSYNATDSYRFFIRSFMETGISVPQIFLYALHVVC